jgi:hypothetical protein
MARPQRAPVVELPGRARNAASRRQDPADA